MDTYAGLYQSKRSFWDFEKSGLISFRGGRRGIFQALLVHLSKGKRVSNALGRVKLWLDEICVDN